MPDADVQVTAGAGTKIDTRTVGAGSDEHRQVMVIGDPVTAANVATVGPEGNLWVMPRGGPRTNITYYGEAYSVTATDALVPITGVNRAGTVTTTQLTVAAGKTFRLQTVSIAITLLGTTVATTRLRLRSVVGAAATVTSPIYWTARIGGTTAIANHVYYLDFQIPDGMEFTAGSGLQFTAQATTAAMHSLDFTLTGYEY